MYHEIRPDRVGAYDQTPAEFARSLSISGSRGTPLLAPPTLPTARSTCRPARALSSSPSTTRRLPARAGAGRRAQEAHRRRASSVSSPERIPASSPERRSSCSASPSVATRARRARPLARRERVRARESLARPHAPARSLDDRGSAAARRGARVILDAVPGYRIKTLALPLGSMPERAGRPSAAAPAARATGRTPCSSSGPIRHRRPIRRTSTGPRSRGSVARTCRGPRRRSTRSRTGCACSAEPGAAVRVRRRPANHHGSRADRDSVARRFRSRVRVR